MAETVLDVNLASAATYLNAAGKALNRLLYGPVAGVASLFGPAAAAVLKEAAEEVENNIDAADSHLDRARAHVEQETARVVTAAEAERDRANAKVTDLAGDVQAAIRAYTKLDRELNRRYTRRGKPIPNEIEDALEDLCAIAARDARRKSATSPRIVMAGGGGGSGRGCGSGHAAGVAGYGGGGFATVVDAGGVPAVGFVVPAVRQAQ